MLLFVIAASDKEPISWNSCNDIALDLTILSAGASGGIFANPTLIQHLGANAAVYGILTVLCDLLLAGILVYLRRWRKGPTAASAGLTELSLGASSIVLTASVLYFSL